MRGKKRRKRNRREGERGEGGEGRGLGKERAAGQGRRSEEGAVFVGGVGFQSRRGPCNCK